MMKNLRNNTVEVYYVDPYRPDDEPEYRFGETVMPWFGAKIPDPMHILIKTFIQTDEEAGGCGVNRRAMLDSMEGIDYLYNGKLYTYKNVGSCVNAPREYAIQTVLIVAPDKTIVRYGDWDYEEILKREGE